MDEGCSVLIVDDDKDSLGMLKDGLSLEGYHCETVTSAGAALEFMRENSFDIMVTDIVMPVMDGLELTEKAKKLRPEMAVIVMTGFIDDFSYDSAIEAGASDFIKKPFSFREITMRLKHVMLQEKLREMSMTDELTGLFNRRGFFTITEQELKLAKRYKKEICMLYADLDGLKIINDTFGHMEGDQALIYAADILRTTFRESDIIARIGGDEFAAIPVGSNGNNIGTITGRLQKSIDAFNTKRKGGYNLSMSWGISHFDPEKPSSIGELITDADKSMYEQKRQKQASQHRPL